jgi:hypothetical protein
MFFFGFGLWSLYLCSDLGHRLKNRAGCVGPFATPTNTLKGSRQCPSITFNGASSWALTCTLTALQKAIPAKEYAMQTCKTSQYQLIVVCRKFALHCHTVENGRTDTLDSVLCCRVGSFSLQEKFFFWKICLRRAGPKPHIPFSSRPLFLYVNLVAREHRMSYRTLAPRLTVLDIPYFADAYSRTVRPIDLHNF